MTKDEKVLKAFWKILDNAKKEDIKLDRSWNEDKIKIFKEGDEFQDWEIASVKINSESYYTKVLFGILPSVRREREYLYVLVRDLKTHVSHYGRIYEKSEIQRIVDILDRDEELKRREREAKEEESLNSLL